MATNKKAPLGSIENPIKFMDQDFKSLLEECLKSGKMFADPTFLAEQKSIGLPEDSDPKKAIKWQRPKVDKVVHIRVPVPCLDYILIIYSTSVVEESITMHVML